MNNILFITDLHIREKDSEELELIFSELLELKKEYKVNKLFICGDSFDNIYPTPNEQDILAKFLSNMNIPTIIIAAKSHESISTKESILNHYAILNKSLKIYNEYSEGNLLYVGHFILKEAKLYKFGATKSKNELKNYKYVILGHGHRFEFVPPNCYQLGSIRWIRFDEVEDTDKKCLIITNYGENGEKCHFLSLKTPYPMFDISLVKNVQKSTISAINQPIFDDVNALFSYLDNLSPKSKVRIVFYDFDNYRLFLPLYNEYSQKFYIFKDKKEFDILINQQEKNLEIGNLKEALKNWIKINKINQKIADILKEQIK